MGAGCVVAKTQMDPLLLFPVCFAGNQSSGRRMSWLKTILGDMMKYRKGYPFSLHM